MKTMHECFCIYVKELNKKRAHFHRSEDGIGWYYNLDDAEQEANHIYTGKQEVTIRQAWSTEKGYTGEDVIFKYPILSR